MLGCLLEVFSLEKSLFDVLMIICLLTGRGCGSGSRRNPCCCQFFYYCYVAWSIHAEVFLVERYLLTSLTRDKKVRCNRVLKVAMTFTSLTVCRGSTKKVQNGNRSMLWRRLWLSWVREEARRIQIARVRRRNWVFSREWQAKLWSDCNYNTESLFWQSSARASKPSTHLILQLRH